MKLYDEENYIRDLLFRVYTLNMHGKEKNEEIYCTCCFIMVGDLYLIERSYTMQDNSLSG